MSFPSETVKWAIKKAEKIKDIARELQQSKEKKLVSEPDDEGDIIDIDMEKLGVTPSVDGSIDKKLLAAVMGTRLTYGYGIDNALETGFFVQWPHEVKRAGCQSQMLVNYVVAKELGLEPEIWEFGRYHNPGEEFIAGHCLIPINVGEPNKWILDQQHAMIGPILEMDDHHLTIDCKVRGEGKKTKEFTYVDVFSEEEYAERVRWQRNFTTSAAVLIPGQKVGINKDDTWKTTEPRLSTYYIRFDEEENRVVNLVLVNRPIIQNRSLESRISFDESGRIVADDFWGSYYAESVWADVLGGKPLFVAPMAVLPKLTEGISGFTIPQQAAFEDAMIDAVDEDDIDSARYMRQIEGSWTRLHRTRHRQSVRMLSLVEGLYQEARMDGKNRKDFVYTRVEHDTALQQFAHDSEWAKNILKSRKKSKKIQRRYKKVMRRVTSRVLDNGSLPDEEIQEYLFESDPVERMRTFLAGKPRFYDDAIDRKVFISREIQPRLREYQKRLNDSALERVMRRGYARIVAEFLGHAANFLPQLTMAQYRKPVLERVQAYKP